MGRNYDPLRIVQAIKIRPYKGMLNAPAKKSVLQNDKCKILWDLEIRMTEDQT